MNGVHGKHGADVLEIVQGREINSERGNVSWQIQITALVRHINWLHVKYAQVCSMFITLYFYTLYFYYFIYFYNDTDANLCEIKGGALGFF